MSLKNTRIQAGPMSAPLRNMNILNTMIVEANERRNHLPGMIAFSGPSGFGKSTACAYAAAQHGGCYIEMRSMWTKKAFLEVLMRELGLQPVGTAYKMLDAASQELAAHRRLVMIDEFDHAVAKDGMVELVRDLYEQTGSTIVLIGEERLPSKLAKWERFYSRVLNWGFAEMANIDDARALNLHYAKDIVVADDLLQILTDEARGSVRMIVTNLDRIIRFAKMERLKTIDAAHWGQRALHTAAAPRARSFA